MPWAALRPCRDRHCPQLTADPSGWCRAHDPGSWAGTVPLPPGWERTRARVLARDRRVCVLCGAAASEVDHIVPRHLGGSEDLANLRSLCAACHRHLTAQQAGRASGWDRG